MLTRYHSLSLSLCLASLAGCGAPTGDAPDTDSIDEALTLVSPTLNGAFERSRLVTVESEVDLLGASVSLAITGPAGEVIQWGKLTGVPATAPTRVPGITNAVAVSTSPYASCALLGDGTVWCWGSWGLMPAPIAGLTGVVSIAQSAAGANCAVRSDRTLWCWGRNDDGALGDGTTIARPTPVRVGLSDVMQVSMFAGNTCARVASGVAYCWGRNGGGQVGDGSTVRRLLPVAVPLFNVVSVQVGGTHSCAVLGTGRVACWGRNWTGELGDGTTVDHLTPTLVSGLSDAVAVAPGSDHTCALTSAGEAWCWGSNRLGGLGSAASRGADQWVPVRAASGSLFTELRAGDQTTCARSGDGRAWCWGSNAGLSLGQPASVGFSSGAYAVPGVQ